jgi:putative polyhydroxyalkanoate system protein
MKHSVQHSLGRDQARKVAEAAIKSYSERFSDYSPTSAWSGDTANIGFSIKGVSLKGSIEVAASEFTMELEVPFLLRPFKGKALGVIEEEIRRWIDKSKAGEI